MIAPHETRSSSRRLRMMATGRSPHVLARSLGVAGGVTAALLAASASCGPSESIPDGVAEGFESPAKTTVCGCGTVAALEPSGPAEPAWGGKLAHGPRDDMVVALTFDACSDKRPNQYDE